MQHKSCIDHFIATKNIFDSIIGREKFEIVYDIMKMSRSKYHYKLRALRKKKHVKTNLPVSKSMLRNSPTTYWKSTSAIRKNKCNTTQIDGVCGDSNIWCYFLEHKGINNSVSLIDHFIMTENMCLLAKNYYTMVSVDNLSDYVLVFMTINCSVKTVPIESDKVSSRSPLWRVASSYEIQQYQLELDNILQNGYPTTDMLLCDNGSSLCLKRKYVSKFPDAIMNATHLAMETYIPHNEIAFLGWDIEMDCASQTSLFKHDI